jgi:Bifunctional PLP-dependent enzyme with beta-cystathionase and maltose regulon repressor activities
MFDFDKHHDRYNTNSYKWDAPVAFGMPEGLQPLWVADMDFPTAPGIIEEIKRVADRGIFGYTLPSASYYDALNKWYSVRHGFDIKREWVVETPGIVFALNLAVQTFTKEDDAVMIQRPVYYPFSNAINNNNRRLVSNSLIYKNGKYTIDFVDFERKIVEEDVKLFILCSPHNPVCRVWTRAELVKMGEICLKHNVLVVADEIHCDFVFGDRRHIPFATVSPAFAKNAVICTAPSKTFNLAGLQASNIIIPNPKLRERYLAARAAAGYDLLNVFAVTACEAAYTTGGEWLDELLKYIYGTYLEAKDYVEKNMPGVRVVELQGTYLMWLDFSELGLPHERLNDEIINRAKVWLDEGVMFGPEGACFMRVNIACPKKEVLEALEKIEKHFFRSYMNEYYDTDEIYGLLEEHKQKTVKKCVIIAVLATVVNLVMFLSFKANITKIIADSIVDDVKAEVASEITDDVLAQYKREFKIDDSETTIGTYVNEKAGASVVEIYCESSGASSAATGMIVNTDGYILTNAHVVYYEQQYRSGFSVSTRNVLFFKDLRQALRRDRYA